MDDLPLVVLNRPILISLSIEGCGLDEGQFMNWLLEHPTLTSASLKIVFSPTGHAIGLGGSYQCRVNFGQRFNEQLCIREFPLLETTHSVSTSFVHSGFGNQFELCTNIQKHPNVQGTKRQTVMTMPKSTNFGPKSLSLMYCGTKLGQVSYNEIAKILTWTLGSKKGMIPGGGTASQVTFYLLFALHDPLTTAFSNRWVPSL